MTLGVPVSPLTSVAGPAPAGPDPALGAQARMLTGEAVHLDVRLAGIGSRALARMIDAVIQVALTYLLLTFAFIAVMLLGATGLVSADGAAADAISIVTIAIGLLGYPVVFETLTRGRTLGKLVLGLRVVRDDGGPITFRHAMTRSLVGFAIEWPGIIGAPLTWLATIWVMITSRLNKRLGDHVAGTVVIHERTPAAWGWTPNMPPHLAGWAAMLDLTGLDDDLALATRDFLARNRRIKEPARSRLGERLAGEVAAVTNPPPPPGTPVWVYLAAVHNERHRRALARLAAVRSRAATVWPDLAPMVTPAIPHPRAAQPAGAPVQIRRSHPDGDRPQ